MVNGMGHLEDVAYLFRVVTYYQYSNSMYFNVNFSNISAHKFRSNKYSQLYHSIMENLDDPINQKTVNAFHFKTKFFAEYAKTG